MRSFTAKENHIGSAVGEILLFTPTDILLLYYKDICSIYTMCILLLQLRIYSKIRTFLFLLKIAVVGQSVSKISHVTS